MRLHVFASLSMLGLASCVIQTGPGSTAPAAAPQPAAPATGEPVAAPAPAPTAKAISPGAIGTIAPAPAPAPAPAGMAVKKPFLRAPEINKGNVFGGTTPAPNTLKGEVFALPEGTKALPSFASLQPFGTFYTATWDVAPRKFTEGFPGVAERVEWFAVRWEGKVVAKAPGVHQFKIKSDDGARLMLDGQVVVDNDGLHPPTEATGQSLLNAGEHSVVIEYFQGPKFDIALQIWVTPPNGQAKPLTTSF